MYKNISLIITHLSELLKFIAKNKEQNFSNMFCYRENFSLKSIPNIQNLMSDSRKRSDNVDVCFLKAEDLIEYLKIPSRLRSDFEHRLIFLAVSGVRFQSSLDLNSNSRLDKKLCLFCSDFNVCTHVTSKCFNYVRILNTKTTEHGFPILPQAWESFKFLQGDPFNISANYTKISKDFNQRLKEKHNLTSHALRKFLPNLMTDFSSSCNTGNWQGPSGLENMKKFYLQKDFKYIVLYMILRQSGLLCC